MPSAASRSVRAMVGFAILAGIAAVGHTAQIDLAAPRIIIGAQASAMERLMARELCRCLGRVTGKQAAIETDDAVGGGGEASAIVLLDVAGNNRLAAEIESRENLAVGASALGVDGFRWKATTCQGKPAVLIAAAKPAGVMYGVYQLLEKIGCGFYLAGDTFPPAGTPLLVAGSLDEARKPVFAVRGTLPWGNLLNAYWDLEDWKFYFDQLSKQGYNFVGLHQYCTPMARSGQPWCAFEWKGEIIGADPTRDSANERWAPSDRPMKTAQFGFGGGDYYDRDPFTERATLEGKNREDKLRRTIEALGKALNYAHTRGIKVCLGFGIGDDPLTPEYERRLEAMIAAMLKNFPMLDYVWFFQEENQGQAGWKVEKNTPQGKLVTANSEPFEYLGAPEKVAEGVRLSYASHMAYRLVKKYRPELPVIISGWGGDHWMHCSDYYIGLDKTLPKDVIFGAQDNLNISSAPTVAKAYGQMPVERQRWPIPWWNNDWNSLWDPQCTTQHIAPICRDVLAKKCQGMLGIHWLTREVEEVAAYQARFAWDPNLTYQDFYDGFAERCYGKPWAAQMSKLHRALESLGPRWTGAFADSDIRPVTWAAKDHTIKPEYRTRLAEIRAQLNAIREQMIAQKRREGLERVEWLTTTIDWLMRYDDACVKLALDGAFGTLLADAEAAQKAGDLATAKKKAQSARDMLLQSGMREAVQTYPKKISSMSDFGVFASIQIKAYGQYLTQWERVKKILGPVFDDTGGPALPADAPPLLVGKMPGTAIEQSQDLPVNVVALSGKPIASCTLHYRSLGNADWKRLPMKANFRHTYSAAIPAADLHGCAIEWFVDAADQSARTAHWPKGYPDVVWSAAISPGQTVTSATSTKRIQ